MKHLIRERWIAAREQRNLRALHGDRPPYWRMALPRIAVIVVAVVTYLVLPPSTHGWAYVVSLASWLIIIWYAIQAPPLRASLPVEYRCGWYDGRRAMRQSSWDALDHGLTWEEWIRTELIRDHVNQGGALEDLESAP